MKRILAAALALGLLLVLNACSSASGPAKAVVSDASFDFGNVPVTNDMAQAKHKVFVIKNEGEGDLKLSNVQVKLLEGC